MDTLIWIILAVVVLAIIVWFAMSKSKKGTGGPSNPQTPSQAPPPAEPPMAPPTEGGQGM